MGRFLAGMTSALLLLAAGLFWWQGRAANDLPAAPRKSAYSTAPAQDSLPMGDPDAIGAAPPMPASASPQSREQKRFARYDRNRDGIITRAEMLSTRVKAFRKLDKDGNNLLSFEEWAAATANRFDGADGNRDGRLNATEFATTAPKHAIKAKCSCAQPAGVD